MTPRKFCRGADVPSARLVCAHRTTCGRDARTTRVLQLLFLVIVLSVSYVTAAWSEEYLFAVPRVQLDAYVQTDGSARLSYDMDFENSNTGHPIDIVDIGLPDEKYNIQEITASLDGVTVSDIRQSELVHPGVEIHLGDKTIEPGQSGNLKCTAVISDLVFQDTTRNDLASFQITPTWFGDQYVQGTSRILIRVHLPAGLNPDEVLYHDVAFTGKQMEGNEVVVSWETEQRLTGPYRVGVSFPKRVVSHVVSMSIMEMLMRWYLGTFSQNTRTWIVIFSFVALGIIFFRFTGGTGCVVFGVVAIATGIWMASYGPAQIFIWPILIVLAVIVETARRRRKSRYLPAIVSVEGGGIKRGLTAPEAAVLLELPLNKVVTMILFGMMKKGLIQQTSKQPVTFTVEPSPPADAIVQPYEKEVLELLKKRPNEAIEKIDFTEMTKHLIEEASAKMKGFDLEETREYYKQIISRAWIEARTIGDLDTWQKKMDEKIDWMMLDPDFDRRFQPYGTRYIPRSYRGFPSTGSVSGGGGGRPSGGSAPRFSDVAASVSGWMQNTAQGVVTKVEGSKGGIMNLGSVDKAFGKALESGGRGGGGGGGGCACACAGCACACACAGGGR